MLFKHFYQTVGWALVIALLCGMPGKDIPHISFLELLSFDKWVHAGIFMILYCIALMNTNTYLLARGKALTMNRYLIWIGVCVAYGVVLEILQGLVFVERSADIYDAIANSAGVVIGYYISRKFIGANPKQV